MEHLGVQPERLVRDDHHRIDDAIPRLIDEVICTHTRASAPATSQSNIATQVLVDLVLGAAIDRHAADLAREPFLDLVLPVLPIHRQQSLYRPSFPPLKHYLHEAARSDNDGFVNQRFPRRSLALANNEGERVCIEHEF